VTELEAMQWLTAAGQSNVDEAAQRSNGNFVRGPGFGEEAQAYDAAKAFIVGNTRASAFTDDRGQTQPLFTARNGDFYRPEVHGQYRNDPNYREYFWQVQGVNLRPDNPTAQEQQQYDQRQAQLNAQIPRDLLLLAGPAAVQAAAARISARGPSPSRPVAGDDTTAAPPPHAAVGDESLPNVHDNQRPRQQSPQEAWQELHGRVDQTRRELDSTLSNPDKPGNVGVAEIQVNGQPATVSRAHSQIGNDAQSTRDGFVSLPPEGERILQPLPDPKGLPRAVDSEYKILENFAQQNRGNTRVEGRIDLFTERPPCDSCSNVIEKQFHSLFPNMAVRVYHSNGQITTYQNGVPTTTTVPVNNPHNWPPVPAGGKSPS
jgi:The  BURPS668_1122 family of deaminases